jgi:hypothetical protein
MSATDLDTFLYASIGQDKNGVPLSMLSVFARRDMDPWEEAAKLCQLSRASAVSELSAMLDVGAGALNSLASNDQALLAARLVALLPVRDNSPRALPASFTSLRFCCCIWLCGAIRDATCASSIRPSI